MRITFSRKQAEEIYEQLAKTWVGRGATRDLLNQLSDFLDGNPKDCKECLDRGWVSNGRNEESDCNCVVGQLKKEERCYR